MGLRIDESMEQNKDQKQIPTIYINGFPGGSLVKNPPANAEDTGSMPGSGSSAAGENGNLLIMLA